jgi:hypothetical protein
VHLHGYSLSAARSYPYPFDATSPPDCVHAGSFGRPSPVRSALTSRNELTDRPGDRNILRRSPALAQTSQTRLLRAKREWPARPGLSCCPISVALMGDLRSNSSLTDEVLGYMRTAVRKHDILHMLDR